jgi:putative hemolysin
MDYHSITLILVIAVMLILSAYFSATETAFSTANKIRLKSLEKDGNRRAGLALKLSEDYNKLLSAILIGNNIVNIVSASVSTVLFTKFFPTAGVTVSTVVMTVLVLIFGEISPKSIANDHAEEFVMFSAPILRFFMVILSPLTWIFGMWKNLISRFLKSKKVPAFTEEELITIVDEAEKDGGIESHEGELIKSAIEFSDLNAKDILTPRVNMISVEENTPLDEIRKTFAEHGLSRLPVYREDVDSILGMIHEKDFYALLFRPDEEKDIHSILSEVVFVAPNIMISDLLHTLQNKKSHMAIVVDEFGGTVGLVTMEDVLEELVGEIWDEHDEVIEYFHVLAPNQYRVSCSADLDALFELLDLEEKSEEFHSSTVSGWVLEEFGHIPEAGETFQYENLNVCVTKTDSKHVLEITVEVIKPEQVLPLAQ